MSAEKSEKQDENWLSWGEIVKLRDALKSATSPLQKEGRVRTLDDEEFTTLFNYLILSLYTLIHNPQYNNTQYNNTTIHNTTIQQ